MGSPNNLVVRIGLGLAAIVLVVIGVIGFIDGSPSPAWADVLLMLTLATVIINRRLVGSRRGA